MQNSNPTSSQPGAASINTTGNTQQNKHDTAINNSLREGETDGSALIQEGQQQAGQPATHRNP